jgi:hypothetical protein
MGTELREAPCFTSGEIGYEIFPQGRQYKIHVFCKKGEKEPES